MFGFNCRRSQVKMCRYVEGIHYTKLHLNIFLLYWHTVTSDGNIIYSEVKEFLHKLPTVNSFYKSITTSKNETINLSGKHLIYSIKNYAEKFSPM